MLNISPRTRPRYCSSCGERFRKHAVRCIICNPPDLSTLGGRVLYALLRKGWTQTEAARRVGIGAGYLATIIKNRQAPSLFITRCLAQVLGVKPGWLAFGEGDME